MLGLRVLGDLVGLTHLCPVLFSSGHGVVACRLNLLADSSCLFIVLATRLSAVRCVAPLGTLNIMRGFLTAPQVVLVLPRPRSTYVCNPATANHSKPPLAARVAVASAENAALCGTLLFDLLVSSLR